MAQSILDSVFSGDDGLAKTLISLLGGEATIQPYQETSYDPLTGVETTATLDAISVDIAALEMVSEKDVDGTTILKGDFSCLVPQSDVTFDESYIQNGTLTFNSIRYRIVEYKPVHSGQNVAMYTLFLRRG